MLFATFLADQDLSWQTIKCYLVAVRNLHLLMGSVFPGLTALSPDCNCSCEESRNQKDCIKETVTQATSSHYTQHLERRVQVYLFSQPCTWSRRMIWAAMNICFFGFLRLGEICTSSASVFDQTTHLAPSDVSLDNVTSPFKMFVTIKASKTDPFRSGVTLVLGATLPYLSIRGTGDGPLFKFEDGSFLYRDQFMAEVRKLLRSAGIEACQY